MPFKILVDIEPSFIEEDFSKMFLFQIVEEKD